MTDLTTVQVRLNDSELNELETYMTAKGIKTRSQGLHCTIKHAFNDLDDVHKFTATIARHEALAPPRAIKVLLATEEQDNE